MPLELPPDLAEIARRDLGETAEVRDAAMTELRGKLSALPKDKRPYRVDDEYLIAFLRGCKFRVDMAYEKIMNMEQFRREHREFTEGLRAEEFVDMYNTGFMRILNGHDREGRVISCLLPGRLTDLRDPTVFMRWNFWVINKVCGQVIIENFEDFRLMDMMRLNKYIPRPLMQQCMRFQQECAPMRMRGIFIVNEPAYMDILWAMVRPFMKKKLRERVHFIGKDVAAFGKFIDPAVLPPEFGGTLDEPHSAWLDAQIALEAAAAAAAAGGSKGASGGDS